MSWHAASCVGGASFVGVGDTSTHVGSLPADKRLASGASCIAADAIAYAEFVRA